MATDAAPGTALIDAMGRLSEFWGFRPNLGRLWTALFLARRPRTSAELCLELGLSAGAVSMALNELLRWRAIRRFQVPGDRREHYEAEPDVWVALARVVEQREVREVDDVLVALAAAERDFARREGEARAMGEDDHAGDAAWAHGRVQTLHDVALTGRELLRVLLADALAGRVDTAPEGVRMLIPRAPDDGG
jgi:DNA-binding transcriptional regulator GbsR (MarR family)